MADTLTDVHLVVGLRVANALKLKLLQGLRELLDGHREICGSEREPASVESRTEPVEAHAPPSCTPGQDYKQTTAKWLSSKSRIIVHYMIIMLLILSHFSDYSWASLDD